MTNKQIVINLITMISSLVLLILSLFLHMLAADNYKSNIPYFLFMGTIFLISIINLVFKKNSNYSPEAFNSILLILSVIPSVFAISNWPGGDDGSGILWAFLIAFLGSFFNIISGIVFFIVLVMDRVKHKNKFYRT